MPRDSSGDFNLVAGNPVAPGEIIASQWANTTMEDIAIALSDSLDRRGRGGMLAPFKFADGSRSAPGATWANEPNTGLYRAGAGDLRMAVRANDVMRWQDEDAFIWDNEAAIWRKILTQGGQGGIPEGGDDGEMIVWSEATQRWVITDELRVLGVNDPDQDTFVSGVFYGYEVQQPNTKIEVVPNLPNDTDPNTMYIVRN
jgi:hypothetical protein